MNKTLKKFNYLAYFASVGIGVFAYANNMQSNMSNFKTGNYLVLGSNGSSAKLTFCPLNADGSVNNTINCIDKQIAPNLYLQTRAVFIDNITNNKLVNSLNSIIGASNPIDKYFIINDDTYTTEYTNRIALCALLFNSSSDIICKDIINDKSDPAKFLSNSGQTIPYVDQTNGVLYIIYTVNDNIRVWNSNQNNLTPMIYSYNGQVLTAQQKALFQGDAISAVFDPKTSEISFINDQQDSGNPIIFSCPIAGIASNNTCNIDHYSSLYNPNYSLNDHGDDFILPLLADSKTPTTLYIKNTRLDIYGMMPLQYQTAGTIPVCFNYYDLAPPKHLAPLTNTSGYTIDNNVLNISTFYNYGDLCTVTNRTPVSLNDSNLNINSVQSLGFMTY